MVFDPGLRFNACNCSDDGKVVLRSVRRRPPPPPESTSDEKRSTGHTHTHRQRTTPPTPTHTHTTRTTPHPCLTKGSHGREGLLIQEPVSVPGGLKRAVLDINADYMCTCMYLSSPACPACLRSEMGGGGGRAVLYINAAYLLQYIHQ